MAMDRSRIWIPGEDSLKDHLPDLEETRKTTVLKGTIRNAVYHKDILQKDGSRTSAVVVTVLLPDGSLRSAPQYKEAFALKGCRLDRIPERDADKEMEKLAELYRSAKGRPVKLEVFVDQL